MKQTNLFGESFETKIETEHTSKIQAPVYEPKNKKPHVLELLNGRKSNRLISRIRGSGVSEDEKTFLIEAAKRHVVFDYSKVADYYAHSSKEMQDLMEQSALVVIDFEKAYQNGYMRLAHEIASTFLDTYADEE